MFDETQASDSQPDHRFHGNQRNPPRSATEYEYNG